MKKATMRGHDHGASMDRPRDREVIKEEIDPMHVDDIRGLHMFQNPRA